VRSAARAEPRVRAAGIARKVKGYVIFVDGCLNPQMSSLLGPERNW